MSCALQTHVYTGTINSSTFSIAVNESTGVKITVPSDYKLIDLNCVTFANGSAGSNCSRCHMHDYSISDNVITIYVSNTSSSIAISNIYLKAHYFYTLE